MFVCDSFIRFIVFDENDATNINQLFNNLKKVRKMCNNLTIVILHHQRKGVDIENKDSLRGSSDIVNSADSIIEIKRRGKSEETSDVVQIKHIKNRAGRELTGRFLKLDHGITDTICAITEIADVKDKEKVKTREDECAEKILAWMRENNKTKFSRNEISSIDEEFSKPTVIRALKILKDQGDLIYSGTGKISTYVRANVSSE